MVGLKEIQPPRETVILKAAKRLQQRMQTDPIIIVEENSANQEIDYFPYLIRDRRIRFNRFGGEIYVSGFREASARVRERTTEEDILFKRGDNPQRIVARRWNKYPDIETAMRGMERVEEKFDKKNGQEILKTRQVIMLMRNLLNAFRAGDVNEEMLKELELKTITGLAAAGFQDAEKTIKQKLSEQLLLAARKDSTDRVNPLVSRSRIASAWVKVTGELLHAKLVREKYSYLNISLSSERDLERFYLDQAVGLMNNVLSRGLANKETERSLSDLYNYSRRYLGSGSIKVNPYSYPSMLAHVFLFGFQNEGQKQIINANLHDSEIMKLLFQVKPVQDILNNRSIPKDQRFKEIVDALAFGRELLVGALESGDKNLQKKDDVVNPAAF